MGELEELGMKLVGQEPHQAYVRLGKSKRAIVMIAGFGQPAECWYDLVKEFSGNHRSPHQDHTIAVILRRQEKRNPPSRLVGWQSIGHQLEEVNATVMQLKRNELKGLRLTLVGHSAGAMLARDCLDEYSISQSTDRLIQICPAPLSWADMFFNTKFWIKGALAGVPYALLALMCITHGLFLPAHVVRGLFTGKVHPDRFLPYYRSLVRDSALFFLQAVLTHREEKRWQHVRAMWHHGANIIIGAKKDPVISERAIMRLVQADMANDELYWLQPGTPHCFWMASGFERVRNLVTIRGAIEGNHDKEK